MTRSRIRKDALRSRRAILDAAHRLYGDGHDASFAEIAAAAGLGQATVYRHFDRRQDLLAALAEEAMARLERKAAGPVDADSLERLLRLVAAEQVRDRTLVAAIRRGELEPARVERLGARARAIFREPLAAAREAGRVRPGIDLADVMAAVAMLEGALAATAEHDQRDAAAERALALLLDGLRA